MTHPPQQPFAPQPYPPQPPPPKASRKGLIAGLVGGLLLGSIIGYGAGAAGTETAAVPGATVTMTPKPAPTVTVTATVEAEQTEPAPEPEPEPEEEPEPAVFEPRAEDFKIGVKIRSKKCFGTAGCSITYQINPEYLGDQEIPDTGVIEITYEVTGGEDGPAVNTFTIEGGTATHDKEERISTPSSSTKLKGKATDATYEEG